MSDDLLRKFAELNPVVDPDRLVAFDEPDLPADPVLRALLEHARANGGRPGRVGHADVRDPGPAYERTAPLGRQGTWGQGGDTGAAELHAEEEPTAHRHPRMLAAVAAAAAVILAVVAGRAVVNDRQLAPLGSANAVTIYGDGDISCPNHVASDRSLPVGTVEYEPGVGELRLIVTLTGAAPHRVYDVALWSDESCEVDPAPFRDLFAQIATDANGAGELDHVFTGIQPGTYRVNVNLVTRTDDPFPPVRDARHREMGTAAFTEVVVPGNGGD